MSEQVFEYTLSLIDYSYLLFFFLFLCNERINLKKYIFSIFIIAFIQYLSETIEIPYFYALKDMILVVSFLLIYVHKFDKKHFIYALLIDSLFALSITIGLSIALLFPFDINKTYIFSWERFYFVIYLKLLTIFILYISVNQLKKLKLLINEKTFYRILLSLASIEIITSYLIDISILPNVLGYFLILLFISLFIFYIVINYIIILKKNSQIELNQNLIELSQIQTRGMMKEYQNIKLLIHDTKNNLSQIDEMLQHKKYDDISKMIQTWQFTYANTYAVAFCNNLYIDAILRQFINYENKDNFYLKINVDEQIKINTQDMVILLNYLIDEAIKHYDKQHVINLNIQTRNNEFTLYLHFHNPSQHKLEPFILDTINGIIDKYDGDFQTSIINNETTYEIILFLS